MNKFLKWFCPIVWLKILFNIGFAIPAILLPQWLLSLLSLPAAYPTVWLRDAGLLLFFLSIIYFPAGIEPLRYKHTAVIMVLAHLTFGVFWLWPFFFANGPKAYLAFGLVDLGFGVVLGILLYLLFREEDVYARNS